MNTNKHTYTCAIVGLGRIASSLEDDRLRAKPCTHAGAISRNRSLRLTAGCDHTAEKRLAFSRRWKVGRVYEDPGDMLENERPDLLAIALPVEAHVPALEKALEAEIPVIICEKPLAPSVEETEHIQRLSLSSRSRILMNYERRFFPDYLYVREIIRSRKYGRLSSVKARVFMGQGRKPADVLRHDTTHMIDILRFLLESEFSLSSVRSNSEAGGYIDVLLDADGIPLSVETSTAVSYLEFSIDFWFSGGMVRIGNGVFEESVSEKSPYYERFMSLKKLKDRKFPGYGPFTGLYSEAQRLLENPAEYPSPGINDGLAALRLIDEIAESLYEPGGPAPVSL